MADQQRHSRTCLVCAHPQRTEIEEAFVGWKSPVDIAEEFAIANRASIYRHAHAMKLFEKRGCNLRGALAKIIERADSVDITAAAVVGAIQAYSKINARGEWVDRVESVNLNDIFDRMTTMELEHYATAGTLPEWFPVGATANRDQEGGSDGQD